MYLHVTYRWPQQNWGQRSSRVHWPGDCEIRQDLWFENNIVYELAHQNILEKISQAHKTLCTRLLFNNSVLCLVQECVLIQKSRPSGWSLNDWNCTPRLANAWTFTLCRENPSSFLEIKGSTPPQTLAFMLSSCRCASIRICLLSLWPIKAEIGTDNRKDTLEELSLQSVAVSLLAQLFVWPGDHSRLGPVYQKSSSIISMTKLKVVTGSNLTPLLLVFRGKMHFGQVFQ